MGYCLNALSGIGGVRTHRTGRPGLLQEGQVLMPCRALEAFGLKVPVGAEALVPQGAS